MVLEELFYGNIRPNERDIKRDSDYRKLNSLIKENENKLFEKFGQKEKLLYESILEAIYEQEGFFEKEQFVYGFRLGAQIMLEILTQSTY